MKNLTKGIPLVIYAINGFFMLDTNLSKKERQKFIEILEQLKENNPDKDTDINNIIAFINDKKYGLVFEKHQE